MWKKEWITSMRKRLIEYKNDRHSVDRAGFSMQFSLFSTLSNRAKLKVSYAQKYLVVNLNSISSLFNDAC